MIDAFPWLTAPKIPQLEPREVHIWRATDADLARNFEAVRLLLNREEHERADQFKFDRDRRWFIFCRGALRQLLAQYIGKTPEEIALSIMSEILAVVNGRNAKPIRDRTTPLHLSPPPLVYA